MSRLTDEDCLRIARAALDKGNAWYDDDDAEPVTRKQLFAMYTAIEREAYGRAAQACERLAFAYGSGGAHDRASGALRCSDAIRALAADSGEAFPRDHIAEGAGAFVASRQG